MRSCEQPGATHPTTSTKTKRRLTPSGICCKRWKASICSRCRRALIQACRSVVALLMLASLAAAISWQWPHMSEMYRSVSQIDARRQPSQAAPPTASQSKFLDRVPQDQGTAQAPATQMPDNQASPTAAQRVVLYQEDSPDSQGKRYFGLVTWRTETVSPAPSSASELQCAPM